MRVSPETNDEGPEMPQNLLQLLKTLEPPVVEPSLLHFRARVWNRITQRQERRRFGWQLALGWRPVWTLVPVAGLVLSLGLNGWFGYQTGRLRQELDAYKAHLTTRSGGTSNLEGELQGDQAAAAGLFADAAQSYESALQSSGAPVATILSKLAGAYVQLGELDNAYETATAALIVAPHDAQAYWYRGLAAKGLGEPTKALENWKQAARRGHREAQQTLQAQGVTW